MMKEDKVNKHLTWGCSITAKIVIIIILVNIEIMIIQHDDSLTLDFGKPKS